VVQEFQADARTAHRITPKGKPVTKLSGQDAIWNRALLEAGGTTPAVGDSALASLLLAHGLAMNGGVVHALECLSPSEIAAAVEGFTYFGLTGAAQVFRGTPDNSEETENRLDKRYFSAVPSDETLAHAFRIMLVAAPEAFAPTGSGAQA
jgi:hypothetical protein